MSVSPSHKHAQAKAAGKNGNTEVPISRNRRLDALSKTKATEVERSGDPRLLNKAANRLKATPAKQKVLQVPQSDMGKASQAMKKAGVSGTVKNMGGTKRRSV